MKLTWKQARLHDIEVRYGGIVEEFKGHEDDRLVFINIYNQIVEAIESLPEEPLAYIRVAMWRQINNDEEILNRIYNCFCD